MEINCIVVIEIVNECIAQFKAFSADASGQLLAQTYFIKLARENKFSETEIYGGLKQYNLNDNSGYNLFVLQNS